jgi:hypothetical protein
MKDLSILNLLFRCSNNPAIARKIESSAYEFLLLQADFYLTRVQLFHNFMKTNNLYAKPDPGLQPGHFHQLSKERQ